ncbi:uncharacterized protein EV422DRAFT_489527, partial [Fimicolochytrium jonesii]|uniref:uncharacterized protein n=1 Tax=Fimicolochytrium jonesii TaxID=1396493 RepID=UPI0022FE4394
ADYGSYIWPSALVLAAYIHHCRHRFAGTRVIELGCGTGLPGLLAAKVGAAQVLLTDAPIFAHVLDNANVAVTMNGLDGVCDVQGVPWGVFPPLPPAPASTMANSVMDSILEEESPRSEHSFDFIIGADVFYEPASFDDLLATVAYILMHSLSTAEFITAYQERSSRRTIQHLLDKWGL